MDPRPPVTFGPFPSEALLAEQHRNAAADIFRSLRCQAAILLTAILSLGIAGMTFWVQLVRYNAALAACAGV